MKFRNVVSLLQIDKHNTNWLPDFFTNPLFFLRDRDNLNTWHTNCIYDFFKIAPQHQRTGFNESTFNLPWHCAAELLLRNCIE
ncbi:hypothetical protein B6D60_00900 [candidate division KSB1 bacterium 4484_87]|nr:MAG: hypothetical protein B6D60_00900 [candidate division KSB1 bacterium 4484_87]